MCALSVYSCNLWIEECSDMLRTRDIDDNEYTVIILNRDILTTLILNWKALFSNSN